jgi:hypothetical protein
VRPKQFYHGGDVTQHEKDLKTKLKLHITSTLTEKGSSKMPPKQRTQQNSDNLVKVLSNLCDAYKAEDYSIEYTLYERNRIYRPAR